MEEHIFSWSLDGFGAKLSRITEPGKSRFAYRYSAMEVDERDQEVRCNDEFEYESFEAFWKEFTDQPLWLRYSPLFIHQEYKPFLQNFFDSIPQGSLTMVEKFRIILWLYKIE